MAIREGLGWVKWLQNGVGEGFNVHAIIPALYLFAENFIEKVWCFGFILHLLSIMFDNPDKWLWFTFSVSLWESQWKNLTPREFGICSEKTLLL